MIPPIFPASSFSTSLSPDHPFIHSQAMAHRSSRDQPPAYMSQDHDDSTTGGSRARHSAGVPSHSTKASTHFQAGAYGSQYTVLPRNLELTFSVMVKCHGSFEAVVVAIDEDYDRLLDDLGGLFGRNARGKKSAALTMKIVWENGWKDKAGRAWVVTN